MKGKTVCDGCAESWEYLDKVTEVFINRETTLSEFKKGNILAVFFWELKRNERI